MVPEAVFGFPGFGGSGLGALERVRRHAEVKIKASWLRAIRFSRLTWLPSRP
jgi:hypothetical protein